VKNLNQFHDGSVEGLLIEGGEVQIFLRTEERQAFVLELNGTLSLKADGFRQTSSIFDVLVREGHELTYDDVVDLYGFTDESKARSKFEQLRGEKLIVVEINPSYGASCLVLANSLDVVRREDWLERYVLSLKRRSAIA
jgi:hypothetical protein